MATSGLYGATSATTVTYFEWFVFQQSATAPATPTGGSWNFVTNTGTPPAGWSNTIPSSLTNPIYASIAFVDSRFPNTIVWSTPGLIGSQGPTGPGSTVTAGTTTTGAAGSSASVVNSGTSSVAVFDFTIPRGDKGDTGAGVAAGGITGQVLAKASNTDYDTSWINLVGGLAYQGNWNASTNTPTLTSSTGTNGFYYTVSVAGSTNLDGITDWQVGDWAIFNGTIWQKIDQTNQVTSVNGYTGGVVLTYTDVGAANSGTNTNITSMTGVTGGISTPDYITFDTNPSTTPTTPGTLYWDSADGNQTLSLVMAGGTATQQIGEEQYFRIKASSAITNGQVVMFTGTVGASGALTGAPATGLTASTASYVMGVATQDIPLNGWGYVTSFGLVRQLDTSAFTAGQILYLDPTVAGGLTATIPTAPNPKVQVCACIYSSASNGSLFIRPSFGGILGQYEGDVNFTSLANGNLIVRDQTTGKWVNANLTAGTGMSVTNAAGSVTVANTGVLSVTGTAPVVSSGGATPAISMAAATTSVNGYLTSADWTTFNNKQAALVSGTNIKTVNSTSLLGSGDIAIAPQAAISNDTTTATAVYPLFAAATSGTPTTIYTSNSSYLYTPSTGELKAKAHVSTNGVTVNSDSVSSNMTIAAGTNGFSVGPLTVNSGVTLTVASGQRHVII